MAGFGRTKAFATPKEGTSLGEYTSIKIAGDEIVKLIDQRLMKPMLVINYTLSTQIALEIAAIFPDK